MSRHQTCKVTCSQGDFTEETAEFAYVQSILADAAMHAITSGRKHVITEHIEDDRTIEAAWTGDMDAIV